MEAANTDVTSHIVGYYLLGIEHLSVGLYTEDMLTATEEKNHKCK